MNNVEYLINKIKQAVPIEILERAFENKGYYRRVRSNIDSKIENEIINGMVIPDCDVLGGREAAIPLEKCVIKSIDEGSTISIPMSVTGGRTITTALSISNSYSYSSPTASDIDRVTNALLGSSSSTGVSSNITPLGNNTFFIDTLILQNQGHIRVLLTNDEGFANVTPKSLHVLSEICEQAAKSFIYNKLRIPIAEGEVRSGISLNVFADIVDGYSDANEIYRDLLQNKWRAASMSADPNTHKKILSLIGMRNPL